MAPVETEVTEVMKTGTDPKETGGVDLAWDGIRTEAIVDSIFRDATEGKISDWISKLGLNQADVAAAISQDVAANDEEATHLTNLINGRIAYLKEKERNQPVRRSIRQEAVRAEEEANQAAIRAANMRGVLDTWGPRALKLGGAAALLYGAASIFEPEIRAAIDQIRMDSISATIAAARNDIMEPQNEGPILDGATLRFPCKKEADGTWRPIEVQQYWPTDTLKGPYFGVNFQLGQPMEADIARAGWGVTVQLTAEQVTNGLPGTLYAKPVSVPGIGASYILPTGAFVPDLNLVQTVFTTGAFAKDGKPMTYFLLTSKGEQACTEADAPDKDTKEDKAGLRMVQAELMREMPKVTLEDIIGEDSDLEIDDFYREEFDTFGLGTWYESVYPGLVASIALAVEHGSVNGVETKDLISFVSYFTERIFEERMVKGLAELRKNVDERRFGYILENINASKAPQINLTEVMQLLIMGADGANSSLGRGSAVIMNGGADKDRNHHVLTHELTHAFFQSNGTKQHEFLGKDYYFTSADSLLIEAMTERLSRVQGTEAPDSGGGSYGERVRLIEALMADGYWNELVDFYSLRPSMILTENQVRQLRESGLSITANPVTRHMYALILDALGISKESETLTDEELKKAKEIVEAIQGMERMQVEGMSGIERLAREVEEKKKGEQ